MSVNYNTIITYLHRCTVRLVCAPSRHWRRFTRALPFHTGILLAISFIVGQSNAEVITALKGAGPEFPKAGAQYEKTYQDLLIAVGKNLPGVDTHVSAIPISRAIRDIQIGNLDFYYPVLCELALPPEAPVMFGSEPFGYIPMGLFSKRSNPITRSDLESASFRITHRSLSRLNLFFSKNELRKIRVLDTDFKDKDALFDAISQALGRELSAEEKYQVALSTFKYVVEALRTHADLLDFPVQPGISIQNGFTRFNRGRIDAYIIPPVQFEDLIANAGIGNEVHRAVFDTHTLCYFVANSERGRAVDTLLREGVRAVKQNGTYDAIFGQNDLQERQWVEKYRNIPINETAD